MSLREKFFCGALALLMAGAGHATSCLASFYDFTVNDGAGDVGHGTLTTTSPSGWGDDSQLAVSGLLSVTATQNAGLLPLGNYSLIPTPGGTVSTSGTGGFFIDSLVYPLNDAASGNNNANLSGNPSYLTNDGLLFGTNGTFEINIWGNGGAINYALYTATSGPTYGVTTGSGGLFTLQQVPEPSSLILAGVAGVVAVGCGLRRRRQA